MTVDGSRSRALAYQECGSGTPVVLLHALPFDRSSWDLIVATVAERARVIACDLRGHGESRRDGPFDMPTHAADVRALLDTLGIQRTTVVGHSLGGYVALELLRNAPERLSGVVLVAAAIDADSAETAEQRRAIADALDGGLAITAPGVIDSLFGAEPRASNPQMIERQRAVAGTVDLSAVSAMLRSVARRPDARALVASAAVPVHVVVGEADDTLDARAISADAGGDATIVPRAGHMIPLEAPEAVVSAILSIIARTAADVPRR